MRTLMHQNYTVSQTTITNIEKNISNKSHQREIKHLREIANEHPMENHLLKYLPDKSSQSIFLSARNTPLLMNQHLEKK